MWALVPEIFRYYQVFEKGHAQFSSLDPQLDGFGAPLSQP
jgi:hypothetical protein